MNDNFRYGEKNNMMEMKCRNCHAKFSSRLRVCPICGGSLELNLNNWYKPKKYATI